MRKLVNRYLSDEIRELGMWSMALLINTNTWRETLNNWRLICLVFWNYGNNDEDRTNRYYSSLLGKIESMSSDSNSDHAIRASKSIITGVPDAFTFDDGDEYDSSNIQKASVNILKRKQKMLRVSRNDRTVNIP